MIACGYSYRQVRAPLAGEWIGCSAPPALATGGAFDTEFNFDDGEALTGLQLFAVANLPLCALPTPWPPVGCRPFAYTLSCLSDIP